MNDEWMLIQMIVELSREINPHVLHC